MPNSSDGRLQPSEHPFDAPPHRGQIDAQGFGDVVRWRAVDEHAEDREVLVVQRQARELEHLGRYRRKRVAAGRNFPDALVSGPLSADQAFPLLLTEQNELPSATRQALEELDIGHVFIPGGNAGTKACGQDGRNPLNFIDLRRLALMFGPNFDDIRPQSCGKESCIDASGERVPTDIMFTGIVQEVGRVRGISPVGDAVRFTISAPGLAPRLAVGDSVACDGACLTVEKLERDGFTVCAVPETLARTTLRHWKNGSALNLEPALTPATPMGGHFVHGHIDGTCEVVEVRPLGSGEGREITVRLPEPITRYCVYNVSICLSGVSLTVAAVKGNSVRVALIPHTLSATNLGDVVAGDHLNFEVDILAKYVERLSVGTRHASSPRDPSISTDTLRKWGYEVP
jgi:riboflavin synthase